MARVAAVRSGKMQLVDAVDALQTVAEQEGGQDEIQRIMSEVFNTLSGSWRYSTKGGIGRSMIMEMMRCFNGNDSAGYSGGH
jgi:ATP-dependent 26S proteasome regulatory subunit